jgi:hypothetical protein
VPLNYLLCVVKVSIRTKEEIDIKNICFAAAGCLPLFLIKNERNPSQLQQISKEY